MRIVIDIDGVICEEKPTFERSLAKPLDGAREAIARLYIAGHTIILYSARGWAEEAMTKNWLESNGIKYHQLILGKPICDVWIDDRAIRFESWDKITL